MAVKREASIEDLYHVEGKAQRAGGMSRMQSF